jgi:Tellurite resistance protein TerB
MGSVLLAVLMVVAGIAGVMYAGIRHTLDPASARKAPPAGPGPGASRLDVALWWVKRFSYWVGRAMRFVLIQLQTYAPIVRDTLLLCFLRIVGLFRRSKGAPAKLKRYAKRANLPGKERSNDIPEDFAVPVDPLRLNCRARIGREPKGDAWQSVLIVDICGTITAPDDGHEVRLEVGLADVTDESIDPLRILSRPKEGSIQGAPPFQFQTSMGKLCHQTTVLEDWTAAGQISPEWCVFPRQGQRLLKYSVAIVSQSTGNRLATAECTAKYENVETGYLDVEDNIQRAKTLAVGLAFSVGAANGTLLDPEVDVIHGWVNSNFGSSQASATVKLELEQALRKTAAFFRKGGNLDVEDICAEIAEIAPPVGRLDILDLCLRVAASKGQVAEAELTLLKNLADWLKVDRARLRTMAEKVLPVSMHQIEDEEMILGLTNEMGKDETRHQLNREYAKWSSRVISSDPAIRKQADEMLNLIANARTQHVGVKLSGPPSAVATLEEEDDNSTDDPQSTEDSPDGDYGTN